MSVIEVVLVYVGIPAGVIFCIVAGVVFPGLSRRKRYRPGEAWEHEPVWYVPHPAALDAELQQLVRGEQGGERPAIAASGRLRLPAGTASAGRKALTGPGVVAEPIETETSGGTEPTARGGAHGEW
ncbi:MAG TPA: hypothetical protein VHC49_04400 [Mycobacteriales bacterium]|nr:hypothetical protein [Mycobacteriales bacterium]